MKNAKLHFVMLLALLVTAGSQAFALKVYTPSSNKSTTADRVYCQGATPALMRTRYYTCNTGTGTTQGTPLTVKWYRNTVDATTGGTLVATQSVNTNRNTSGNVSYSPSTTTPGVYYYYTVMTWTGAGTCNTSGSLTSTTIKITVSESPSAISGSSTVCVGNVTTLTNTASGGTWRSSNVAKATVDVLTGEVTGVAAGTTLITYRVACGTRVYKTMTISATPTVAAISGGTSNICTGSTATLTNSTSGGTWTSGSTSIATINSSGVVTGVSPGVATISYQVSNTCGTIYATKDVTVTTTPSAISGLSSTCTGYTLFYTNTAPYGTWTSANSARATVDAETGEIDALTAGTVNISYSTGCGSTVTKTLTVNSGPTAISGTTGICIGGTSTLTNGTGGGTWSSSNTSVATIGSTTGLMTGVAAGTARITYGTGSACQAVITATVKATPAAISGANAICTGATSTYTNTTLYGTWSSSNTSVATIGSTTGIVTGVAQGTARLTYTTGCGTAATKVITVNTQPGSITGTASVCQAATTTLANAVSGGVWTTESAAIATVNSSGVVTGVAEGAVDITYTNGVCRSTREVTVNPLPDPGTLDGDLSICDGDETDLTTDGDEGGTWTTSSSSIASVDAAGTVTGNNAGTARISYTVTNSCGTQRSIVVVTVNAAPNAGNVSGSSTVCQSATTTYTSTVSGGIWSSSDAAVAAVGTGGVISGIAGGNATITYTYTNGCGSDIDTKNITVNPLPSVTSITGTATVCAGSATALSNATSGGAWSSSSTAVATAGTSGVVTGIAAGTATISYGVTNSCGTTYATQVVTVNPLPAAGTLSGTAVVCVSSTTNLSPSIGGGAWTTSNASVATVSGGTVTGVANGNATISYAVTNSCGTDYATQVVTVNPLPAAGTLSGTAVVCVSSTTNLSPSIGGGAWTTSNASVATVSGGTVTGVASGNATISYAVTNSCGTDYATQVVTVNALPAAGTITGTAVVCEASTTNLSASAGGGAWTTSNASVATVSGGTVTGVAAGNATISYAVTNSCGTDYATQVVTVNALPAAGTITGTAVVCEASTTNLSASAGGGAWTTSDASVATVSGGTVTGVAPGNATMSYAVTNSCGTDYATQVVTVNPLPAAGTITGAAVVCEGSTTDLSASVGGGAWATSDASVATVSGGTVTGVANGNATISYAVTNSCGTDVAIQVVTVNALPDAGTISGAASVCVGSTASLSASAGGGAWTTSDASVATVSGGTVTGVASGNAAISYAVTTSCGTDYATLSMSVIPVPAVGSITGATVICAGSTADLDNSVSGGVWTTSDASVATVDGSGVVTGVAAGNANISYSISNSCGTATDVAAVTVNQSSASISGANTLCLGGTTTFTISDAAGAWSTSDAGIATVNASTGVINSVSLGSVTITYTAATGCFYSTKALTVNSTVASISGTQFACVGSTSTLANATGGGAWSSSNAAIASVDASTGEVTAVSAGTATITYTVAGGCYNTAMFISNAMPDPITGTATICTESYSVLYSTVGGAGTWTSSNTSVAAINNISGWIDGISAGNATVTYRIPATGCQVTREVTVNASPAAISGATPICAESTVAFTNSTSGGTWTSSQPTVASIDASTGAVTANIGGGTVVTYTLPNGCLKTYALTVNALPGNITSSNFNVCLGIGTTMASATSGGTWSSGNTSVATIGSSSGVVTSQGVGSTPITYTAATGCIRTQTVSVYSATAPIVGPDMICKGYSASYSNATSGGTWISSNTSIASINCVTGMLSTGMVGGSLSVSYRLTSNGCIALKPVTVAAITGNVKVCIGSTTTLSHAMTGGTWSSSNTARATVDASTGVVTGVTTGTCLVTYFVTPSIYTTAAIIVNPLPASITGAAAVCEGSTAVYSGLAGSSATWSSSDVAVGTVFYTSGMFTAISEGTTTLTYKIPNTGCYTTYDVTVLPAPAVISGASSVCVGETTTMMSSPTGGVWSRSNGQVSINATTGDVTGVAGGGVTITYTAPNGCRRTKAMTVNAIPAAITGATTISMGGATMLSCPSGGGTWSSSHPGVANPGTITGLTGGASCGHINGLSAGVATISYTFSNGCARTANVTVVAARPGAVTANEGTGPVNSFRLYPNPASGTFFVESSVEGNLMVLTVDGKLAGAYNLVEGTTNVTLPGNLASGIYMCQFTFADGTTKVERLYVK